MPGTPHLPSHPNPSVDPSCVPEIVAHRGYTLEYPENTLTAIRAAIAAGARHVEIDVQLSRDAIPVLFHDADLIRVCGERGSVHEKSLSELLGLSAAERSRFGERYAEERIPTLAEFCSLLDLHPGVSAFVEVKAEAIQAHGRSHAFYAIHQVISRIQDQCVLISFDRELLHLAREHTPGLRIGVVVDRWDELNDPLLHTLRADYVFCDVEGLPSSGSLQAPHDARLAVYEVADASLARALAARGVNMIETFSCAEMLRALGETTRTT